jgi:hypothetical protein
MTERGWMVPRPIAASNGSARDVTGFVLRRLNAKCFPIDTKACGSTRAGRPFREESVATMRFYAGVACADRAIRNAPSPYSKMNFGGSGALRLLDRSARGFEGLSLPGRQDGHGVREQFDCAFAGLTGLKRCGKTRPGGPDEWSRLPER